MTLTTYVEKMPSPRTAPDSALDDLKAKTRPHGEIITFLPTGEGGDAESVELEILVASRENINTLRGAIAGPNVSIEEVRRRDAAPLVVRHRLNDEAYR